jgi:hypothetical protein
MGELFVDGKHVAWTLERCGPQYKSDFHRIPAGSYKISIYNSPHFGREMPLLRDTPRCPVCEIHWGNVPGASHCCILIGKQKGQDTLFFTRAAFDELFPAIQTAAEQTAEGCSIDIFDVPLSNHDDVQSAVSAT